MSSRDGLHLSLLDVPSLTATAGCHLTPTTPTLTPTTLRNIEQMFVDGAASECRPPDQHENAARFEPPAINLQEVVMITTAQQQLSLLPSEAPVFVETKVKEELPVAPHWLVDGSAVLPGPHSDAKLLVAEQLHSMEPQRILPTEPVPCDSVFNGFVISQQQQPFAQDASKQENTKPPRGRRARDLNLSPQELEKRQMRRQRNKEAAARCRKRRMDQTMTLQEEVDQWEAKRSSMQQEIKVLENQKVELETLLQSHRNSCKAKLARPTGVAKRQKGSAQKGTNGLKDEETDRDS